MYPFTRLPEGHNPAIGLVWFISYCHQIVIDNKSALTARIQLVCSSIGTPPWFGRISPATIPKNLRRLRGHNQYEAEVAGDEEYHQVEIRYRL